MFQMEIKIGSSINQLVIRQHDNVEDVIKAFAKQHKLSQKKEDMIIKMVTQTLETYASSSKNWIDSNSNAINFKN